MDIKQIAKEIFNLKWGWEIRVYQQNNPNFIKLLKNTTSFLPNDAKILERAFCILNGITKKIKCKECNNYVKWKGRIYADYCSNECKYRSNSFNQKRKKTNLERYGVEYPLQNKQIREKIKQTNLKKYGIDHHWKVKKIQHKRIDTFKKKYGVDNPVQNKEIQEKIKQTNLNRYGCEYHFQNKDIQRKIKKTNLTKYGTEYPQQNKQIHEKTKQTNLIKYGVENTFSNKEIQEKIKQTNLTKYGVENPSQNNEIRKKTILTNIKLYGTNFPTQNKEIQEKIKQTNLKKYGTEYSSQKNNLLAFQLLSDYDWLYDQYINLKKTATQISLELNINVTTICNYLHTYNIVIVKIYKFSYKAITWLEYIMEQENIFIQHVGNIGEFLIPNTNYSADGYCKKTNTIYEFHGDLWHGNPKLFNPDNHCHPFNPEITAGELYEKTIIRENKIKELGYNLIVIWENEWDNINK